MPDFKISELEDTRSQEAEEYNLQEAHFYSVLAEFAEIVRQYGIEKAMWKLDIETYWILEKWFIRGEVAK